MSEELKKNVPDAALNLEDLDKVAGGNSNIEYIGIVGDQHSFVIRCPYCAYNIQFPATTSDYEVEEQMAEHIKRYHPTGEPMDDII